MKKKPFLLLLFMVVVTGIYAQDDAARLRGIVNNALEWAETNALENGRVSSPGNGEFPSISIFNNTGYTVKSIFISRAGTTNWGRNILRGNLYHKQSTLVNIQTPLSEANRYNIRMVDEGGDSYSKRNIVIGASTNIEFVIGDLDQ